MTDKDKITYEQSQAAIARQRELGNNNDTTRKIRKIPSAFLAENHLQSIKSRSLGRIAYQISQLSELKRYAAKKEDIRENDQPCDPKYLPISKREITRTAKSGELEEASRLYFERGNYREINEQIEFEEE
jgi:hypothetical protein